MRRALIVWAGLLGAPTLVWAQAEGITDLGAIHGRAQSAATAVSGDGTTVVGNANGVAFRWTQASGMLDLSPDAGTLAFAVSRDGSVVVGTSLNVPGGGAFRWTQASGVVSLGNLAFGSRPEARGVSSDGSVIVGTVFTPFLVIPAISISFLEAFRWTEATGMVALGTPGPGTFSGATGVSGDGSVIVGFRDGGTFCVIPAVCIAAPVAFRWTQATGMVPIGTLNGGGISQANAISRDGNVIVGISVDGAANAWRAFRWTQASGMVSLGNLAGKTNSSAAAVNFDGSVIVGNASDPNIFGAADSRAFRWTQATGMQSVEDWLRSKGVNVPVDTTLAATGVSDDGNVVVGSLLGPSGNTSAFIARVSPVGNGMITLQDLQSSLTSATNAIPQATSLGNTVLHGAHSRPLARRVAAGKSCMWVSGDAGRDDHGARDGAFGLAEVGGCHRFASDVQASLSLGVSGSRQDLVFDGKNDVRTRFGVAELLGKIPGTNFWPSAALLFQQGHADVKRGYLNAGALDASRGRPDVRTTAARVRVDWDSAVRSGDVSLSPYADVSYARTRIDGYTEGGGGFPAQFDARTEKSTEARIGADAAYALSADFKLLGRLEGVHRFEKTGVNTSGTVLGLSSFDFPGTRQKRDWLRAGVGVDAKVGSGLVSAMLNVTTQGAAPSYWLNLSYQVVF